MDFFPLPRRLWEEDRRAGVRETQSLEVFAMYPWLHSSASSADTAPWPRALLVAAPGILTRWYVRDYAEASKKSCFRPATVPVHLLSRRGLEFGKSCPWLRVSLLRSISLHSGDPAA